ncbi:MAG: 4Fe-4S binding protein [Gammaproteobacteria bacterium]|nr:4Fe-4S binding protein [Gammaproteobacteria bacterium]
MNLSVIRKFVQATAFVALVYGVPLGIGGFYLADNLSNALPALACVYDKETADHCALISLQHQMDHRVAPMVASGGSFIQAIMPTLITLGTFLLLFVILNKAFCGWICPLGTFQEMMTIIGQKLGLQQRQTVSVGANKKIRPIKWLMLAFLIFFFPLLAGFGVVGHELGSPFCSICPSRILTTLATGDTSEMVVDSSSDGYMMLSLIATFGFGLMMAIGLTLRQPFCRICPMLAMHAVFKKLGLVRLVKEGATSRCEKCNLCTKACPMDIELIATELEKRDVLTADCTLCGRCVEFCPDKGVLQMKYAVIPILSADPAYFKKRKQSQSNWEKSNLLAWWQKRKSGRGAS